MTHCETESILILIVFIIFLVLVLLLLLIMGYYRTIKIKSSDLKHRYVLITGCDTGFGNLTVRRLDTAGFHVFAACLTADKVAELASVCSGNVLPVQLDVTNATSVENALDVVKNRLPRGTGLWAVINNAGIVGPVGLCEWLGREHFQKPIDVNLLGTIRVTNAFLPLVRLSRGRIINTSSVVGRLACTSGPYSVSKFCLEGYTDCLRRQMSVLGVSVHTIEPGGYATNVSDASLTNASMEQSFDSLSDDVKEFYGEQMKHKLSVMTRLACYLVGCRRLHQVVDAYLHAVTARHPKTRYVVGWNANLLFRPLWSLPAWMADFLLGMCYPLPKGCS